MAHTPTPSEILAAALVLGASLLVAWLSTLFLGRTARRLARRTTTRLDNELLRAVRRPLIAAIVLAGLYFSYQFIPFSAGVQSIAGKVFSGLFSVLGVYAVAAVLNGIMTWYSREVAARTRTSLDDRIVAVIRLVVPVLAGLLALMLVLEVAGIELRPVKSWLSQHGGQIALILVLSVAAIFALGQAVPKAVASALGRRAGELEEEAKKRADTLSRVLVAAGEALIIIVAVFMLLSELGIDIGPLLAGAGVVGVAIGFGAQNLIRDLLAGLFIILENQYRVGDVVKIADVSGLVEDINLRRTVLRDLDGIVHVVPNGEIRVASNFTREWSRVNMNISVAYGEDLDRAIAVINQVGRELAEDPQWAPFILKAPQVLRVDNLGESGVEIKILGDTRPLKQWDVMGELRLRLKKAFDEAGIEFPWPHTKVYFGNTPPAREKPREKKG